MCDPDFKPDLTAKICQLVQRFAPDKRWYIDSLVKVRLDLDAFLAHQRTLHMPRHAEAAGSFAQVLVQSGAHAQEDACRALVFVIMSAAQLHAYAVRAMFHRQW